MIFHKVASNCFNFRFSVGTFCRNKIVQNSNKETRKVLTDYSVVFIVNFEHFPTTFFIDFSVNLIKFKKEKL